MTDDGTLECVVAAILATRTVNAMGATPDFVVSRYREVLNRLRETRGPSAEPKAGS